ncbi:MAG: hypothetical protein DI570_21765 [Phenylobacterium zucineum]|nr:MAG: hypothetical protein DI570_21765 [Phenylobacterium zucineum]
MLHETNAEPLIRLSSVIGQALVILQHAVPDTAALAGSLGQLHREAEALGLKPVVRQLERIKAHFISGEANSQSLRAMIADLYQRLLEAMEERTLLLLSDETARLYTSREPAFGAAVQAAFPSAGEDIAEAAKCLALERHTATVFHLMRVLERGLRAQARETQATPGNPNWETVLNAITTKVNQMGPADGPDWKDARHFHAEAVAEFRIFQHAWRNYVMHADETYDADRARKIYGGVEAFMRHLAQRVTE